MTTGYRLPDTVSPRTYAIDLETSPERPDFSGTVTIDVELTEASETVELHARELEPVAATWTQGEASRTAVTTVHADREVVELRFDPPLPAGPGRLEICYRGRLNEQMAGLYLAETGEDRAVVSQCEAPHARAIFPCFDEPHLKATLQWTVRTDPGLVVVTNGALERTHEDAETGQVVHEFEPTKVMSTYLAAVTVGAYRATEPYTAGSATCRSFVLGNRLGQTALAEEITSFALRWFEEYFQQRYHYGKLDQVAVPGFDAGAMENVGAIFYRAQLFLTDPASSSWSAQKEIAEVVAHELAHQWFGNRVTMKWWDDLWLNEAFATWVSHKVVNHWRPQWRIWDEFLGGRREALSRDALTSTHPIYSPVGSPSEATEMFDAITYFKGCCVLRQIENHLGAEPFRDGLRDYIERFKDGNAAGSDLWQALARSSGEDVEALAESWIGQPGFPLIRFDVEQRDGKTVVHTHQRRFFASAEALSTPVEQTWRAPVGIRYAAGGDVHTHQVLVTEQEQDIELPAQAEWVYPNADAIGFYRCHLSDSLREQLYAAGLSELTPPERESVFEDMWALVVSGLAPIDEMLDTLIALQGETDYAVLRSINMRLAYLRDYLVPEPLLDTYRATVRSLFGEGLEALGLQPRDDESETERVARAELFSLLGDTGRNERVLEAAEAFAERERDAGGSVPANLAGVAVRLAALRGDEARQSAFIQEYRDRVKRGASPELQSRYLGALPLFESPELVDRALQLTLDGTVPQEQLTSYFGQLFARRPTQLAAWSFLKENWDRIGSRIGPMGISRLVECPAALPVELRDEVEDFFSARDIDAARRALAQTLEAMENRRKLTEREQPRIEAWLQKRR